MGALVYSAGTSYEMDDRTLAHVKVAVGLRLRRHESFYLTWMVPPGHGSGRISIWVSPAIPLEFRFASGRVLELNRQWLQAMNTSAEGEAGMLIMHEDEAARFVAATGAPDGPPVH
ncbi:MAG: hypothetical protein ABWY36_08850 [Leifsonia sp.]